MEPFFTFICVLYNGQKNVPDWSRNIFDGSWVDKLYRGIKKNTSYPFRFICLVDKYFWIKSDIKEKGVEVVRLENNNSDMFSLMECFRPDLPGERKVFAGLDTVIINNIDFITDYVGNFGMVRDPYVPERMASGVMAFNRSTGAKIYEKFRNDANKNNFVMASRVSDMIWLNEHIDEIDCLTDIFPNRIASYKAEIKTGKIKLSEASIVYFHGREKPHELTYVDFIKKHWK